MQHVWRLLTEVVRASTGHVWRALYSMFAPHYCPTAFEALLKLDRAHKNFKKSIPVAQFNVPRGQLIAALKALSEELDKREPDNAVLSRHLSSASVSASRWTDHAGEHELEVKCIVVELGKLRSGLKKEVVFQRARAYAEAMLALAETIPAKVLPEEAEESDTGALRPKTDHLLAIAQTILPGDLPGERQERGTGEGER